MGQHVHAGVRRHCRRHAAHQRGVENRNVGQQLVVGNGVLDVGLRVGDDREAGGLAARPAGGGHRNAQRLFRPGGLLIHVTDGLGRVDGRAAAHGQHRVRLVRHDPGQSLHHQLGVGVGGDVRKNPILGAHLVQHPQQLVHHPRLFHKGIADDAQVMDGILLQVFKGGLARVDFGRYIKGVHR